MKKKSTLKTIIVRTGILAIIVGIAAHLLMPNKPIMSIQRSSETFAKFNAQSTEGTLPGVIRLLDEKGQFICSGAVVSDEYAVTAAHCVSKENAEMVKVRTVQDETKVVSIPGTIVGLNHRVDYALIHGNFKSFKKFKINQNKLFFDESAGGMAAFGLGSHSKSYKSCGYPQGLNTIYCTSFSPAAVYNFMVAGNGNLFPGMSGGPVIDEETNEVVAVNSGVSGTTAVVAPMLGILSCFNVD